MQTTEERERTLFRNNKSRRLWSNFKPSLSPVSYTAHPEEEEAVNESSSRLREIPSRLARKSQCDPSLHVKSNSQLASLQQPSTALLSERRLSVISQISKAAAK